MLTGWIAKLNTRIFNGAKLVKKVWLQKFFFNWWNKHKTDWGIAVIFMHYRNFIKGWQLKTWFWKNVWYLFVNKVKWKYFCKSNRKTMFYDIIFLFITVWRFHSAAIHQLRDAEWQEQGLFGVPTAWRRRWLESPWLLLSIRSHSLCRVIHICMRLAN